MSYEVYGDIEFTVAFKSRGAKALKQLAEGLICAENLRNLEILQSKVKELEEEKKELEKKVKDLKGEIMDLESKKVELEGKIKGLKEELKGLFKTFEKS